MKFKLRASIAALLTLALASSGGAQVPNAKVYHKQGGAELVVGSGGTITVESGGTLAVASGATVTLGATASFAPSNGSFVYNQRFRFTVAQVNAGATVLPAIAGYKYRLIDCYAIAVGGAAAAVTTVDILGTQSSGVKLVAYAQASLTQSTVLRVSAPGAAVLADGASFIKNDVNTAITIGITGSSVTTATHIDVVISYAVEA